MHGPNRVGMASFNPLVPGDHPYRKVFGLVDFSGFAIRSRTSTTPVAWPKGLGSSRCTDACCCSSWRPC